MNSPLNIALIAPPWQLFHRPSIQTAALKAFIRQERPGYRVKNFHPYLFVADALGLGTYHRISQSGWASEAVCSALLFPEKGEEAAKLLESALRKRGKRGEKPEKDGLDARDIISKTGKVIVSYLDRLPLHKLHLVGITACLNQFTASLFIASIIKKRFPELPLLLGGSSCSGMAGPSILKSFQWIDYVIGGEGEIPLAELCDYIAGKAKKIPAGVLGKKGSDNPGQSCGLVQTDNLDNLPTPDYDDYFREKALLGPANSFQPDLCVEASRGCWWGRCNFCNLNIQWEKYRSKSVDKISEEVNSLSERYGCLDFAFMDNALPPRHAPAIFRKIGSHGRDYSFFAELRTGSTREEIKTMAEGGLRELQVGIEALSSTLLKRLNKGSRVIDNIAAMRHAAEYGINLQGNLILHFPGSTAMEAEETLEVLDWLWPFPPLKPVSFWLGSGSPVSEAPEKFQISGVGPDPRYGAIFPGQALAGLSLLILSYRGDRVKQKKIWREVRKKLSFQEEARRKAGPLSSLLSYRDGREFILIRQVLPDGKTLHHRLSGTSRELYLEATDIISFRELAATRQYSENEIRDFFKGLARKRLAFIEDNHVISLAVKEAARLVSHPGT
jgi:ribosomal peptide maturation radical SAM protein 1